MINDPDTNPATPYADIMVAADDKNVVIRTTTMTFVGHVRHVDARNVVIDNAIWIADSGRWGEFVDQGDPIIVECEVYEAARLLVLNRDSIIEVFQVKPGFIVPTASKPV